MFNKKELNMLYDLVVMQKETFEDCIATDSWMVDEEELKLLRDLESKLNNKLKGDR